MGIFLRGLGRSLARAVVLRLVGVGNRMKTEDEIRKRIDELEMQSQKAKRQYAMLMAQAEIAALRWVLGEELINGFD